MPSDRAASLPIHAHRRDEIAVRAEDLSKVHRLYAKPAAIIGRNGRASIAGWIGSPTTASYIRALAPVLQRAGGRRRFVLRVSGAGEPLADDEWVEKLGRLLEDPVHATALARVIRDAARGAHSN